MDSMMLRNEIKSRYEKVLNVVKECAKKANRNFEEIKIVAVTKAHPVSVIREALSAGLRIFGENYAQELRDKVKELKEYDIEWHYIGRIQTNKLKYIVPVSEIIHSIYREEELVEINKISKKIGKVQSVLIEVNVSAEESKAGVRPEDVESLLEFSKMLENVRIIGLMTIAPFIEPEKTRGYFKTLRELRDRLSLRYPTIKELSMGMSNDYWVAVEEGSTILRIGTAIFGERRK
ncbi:MAG: YggS family pyridoxal phosphate-dependent enzyme [Fervidobacterium sp.]|nr:YggS family pyridoxal phosphate-dependent enzyme [Fervidobacterium sp.]